MITVCEVVVVDVELIERTEGRKKHLHCIFRFEMEHLLERTGFIVQSLYSDFFCEKLQDKSADMIWVAQIVS